MIEEAVINIGLTYNEFLNMTMYQYRLCVEQWRYKHLNSWEHTRLIAYTIYCTVAKDKISIDKFMKLSSDKIEEEKNIDPERLLELQRIAVERIKIIQNLQKNS